MADGWLVGLVALRQAVACVPFARVETNITFDRECDEHNRYDARRREGTGEGWKY